jgi:hypothetical protein
MHHSLCMVLLAEHHSSIPLNPQTPELKSLAGSPIVQGFKYSVPIQQPWIWKKRYCRLVSKCTSTDVMLNTCMYNMINVTCALYEWRIYKIWIVYYLVENKRVFFYFSWLLTEGLQYTWLLLPINSEYVRFLFMGKLETESLYK